MKITKWGPVLTLGLLAFLATSPVHADTVYTYTGTPYTNCFGTYTCTSTGPLISIEFETTTPLAANLPYATDITPIIWAQGSFANFVITDGTMGGGLADALSVFVGTDANGNINQWDIFVNYERRLGSYYSAGQSLDYSEILGAYDTLLGGGNTSSGPGTWTVTQTVATPEPSSMVLLGAGLLGLALIGIRR